MSLLEDVKIGDQMLATIVGTGAKPLVEITVDATTEKPADEDGDREGTPGPTAAGDTVIATDEHPFWAPELGQWVAAIDLVPGMWLQTSAGTWIQITAIQAWTQAATVHNLTIQDQHTYYVLVGETPVFVHNTGILHVRGPKDPLNFGSNYTGRVDRFDIGGTTDFEVHVYRKGKEVGIFDSDGWLSKHGKSADVDVPRNVYNNLKGLAVGELRRDGRIGPKVMENIKGDNWKRPRVTGGGC
ncbi:polymorphic toxin-type HINT domain-containing protein [Thermobifida halotolerans]|uniref:polymorphic toxin-type HINT domain-containing protein n=1 Tax=Thermobifida halotolerans TaxID=483545 RepID=UPI0022772BDB|nr:polymorphic toxin-type HINT domain-containing protein [Thermobifida halotolerans]